MGKGSETRSHRKAEASAARRLVRCRVIPGNTAREFPADQLRFRLAAYGIALQEGAVLLGHSAIAGWWELPGGRVEPDETLAEGLAREFAEETGLRPAVGDPVGFDEDFIAFFGHAFHGVRLFFRVDVPAGAALLPQQGEITELAWRPWSALHEDELAPGHLGFILRAVRSAAGPAS